MKHIPRNYQWYTMCNDIHKKQNEQNKIHTRPMHGADLVRTDENAAEATDESCRASLWRKQNWETPSVSASGAGDRWRRWRLSIGGVAVAQFPSFLSFPAARLTRPLETGGVHLNQALYRAIRAAVEEHAVTGSLLCVCAAPRAAAPAARRRAEPGSCRPVAAVSGGRDCRQRQRWAWRRNDGGQRLPDPDHGDDQGTTTTGTTKVFYYNPRKTTIFLLVSTNQTRNGILYYGMEAIWKRAQHNWKCHIEKILPPEFFYLTFPSIEAELAARIQRPPNSSERTPTAHTFDSING